MALNFYALDRALKFAGKFTVQTMGVAGFMLGLYCLYVHANL